VRDGKLALGKNLKTAYIADKGFNSDDAITISESGAAKMTSEHMTTFKLTLDENIKVSTAAHAAHCPNIFTS